MKAKESTKEKKNTKKTPPNSEEKNSENIEIPNIETIKEQKRKEFEIKTNVIITEMRKSGSSEDDILEYIDDLKAKFELEQKKSSAKESMENPKKEMQKVLEKYFQSFINYDKEHQSPEEFKKLKQKYDELIKNMLDMSEEELENQYDIINKARKEYYKKYNERIIFKECLKKEISLKTKSGILKEEDIPEFKSRRIESFLAKQFDYAIILKENVYKNIIENTTGGTKLVEVESLPDIKSEIKRIKTNLEKKKQ